MTSSNETLRGARNQQRRAGTNLPSAASLAGASPAPAGSRSAAAPSGKSRRAHLAIAALLVLPLTACGGSLMALEKPEYEVLTRQGDFELRQYEPYLVAETTIDSDFEEAGNEGFRRLADYIFGNNRSRQKLDMTAPVSQTASEKIAMTAPVNMHRQEGRYRVTFMMPSEYTLETLPEPINPQVRLRRVPGELLATIRYSGTWSQSRYDRHEAKLHEWVARQGWEVRGEAIFARYDPPIVPWFLRRNEILIPVTRNVAVASSEVR